MATCKNLSLVLPVEQKRPDAIGPDGNGDYRPEAILGDEQFKHCPQSRRRDNGLPAPFRLVEGVVMNSKGHGVSPFVVS